MRKRLLVFPVAVFSAALARADGEPIASLAVAAAAALMPARICLASAHGFVDRIGTDYRFSFDRAPMIEAMEAVARIFSAPVAWSGPDSAEFTGSFIARTPGEALAKLAEGSGRRVRLEGSVWSLREYNSKAPPEFSRAGLSAAAKGGR